MVEKVPISNTPRISEVTFDYGKIPPQAIDLEESVLGAIMIEKDAILSVIDVLKQESFYIDAHQLIFKTMLDLSMEHKPIDLLTVTEELRKKRLLDLVGGPFYLSQLTEKVTSTANIEYHARIIAQKHLQRELIRVAADIQKRSFDESTDVDDLIDYSEEKLFSITQGNIKKETQPVKDLLKQAIQQIEEAGKRENSLSGVPSGFTKLDRITCGWQRSDLIIIAARPSMGKTAFILSMARNIAVEHKRSVAIFSLEMSSLQLVNRLIVSETELPSDKIRNGRLKDFEWEQLDYRIKGLTDAPLFIDDTPALSIMEFRAKCRRLKANFNVELIIVDYLQLMTGPNETRGNREQEVSIISRSLKSIAKELDVPIIALSQLNRSVELRTGSKKPQLSDLRESGAIEQDADLVLFLYRAEKYGLTEDEEGNSTLGLAEVIVAKHRNGALGSVQLRFQNEFAKFTDLEESYTSPFSAEMPAPTVIVKSRMNEEFPSDIRSANDDFFGPGPEDESPF